MLSSFSPDLAPAKPSKCPVVADPSSPPSPCSLPLPRLITSSPCQINRKILPAFYALLLTPPASPPPSNANASAPSPPPPQLSALHRTLTTTLQTGITSLVNASHVTGPFFLGALPSFVDVAFAPWIIRLSRVLRHFRAWPDPEVGSRWEAWVSAIEGDERVKRTVSDEAGYRGIYGKAGVAGLRGTGLGGTEEGTFAEFAFAKRMMGEEGFGLGGDVWGPMDKELEMQRLRVKG
jgi:hypothetical protein